MKITNQKVDGTKQVFLYSKKAAILGDDEGRAIRSQVESSEIIVFPENLGDWSWMGWLFGIACCMMVLQILKYLL